MAKAYEKRKKALSRRHEWRSVLHKVVPAFVLAAVLLVTYLYLWVGPVGARLELSQMSLFYWLRGEREKPQDLVLVGIDDITYAKLQNAGMLEGGPRFGMPRKFTAEAVFQIQSLKPKALFIDAYIAPEKLDPKADERMEEALKMGPAVIATYQIYNNDDEDSDEPEVEFESDKRFQEAAHAQVPYLFGLQFNHVSKIQAFTDPELPIEKRMPLRTPLSEILQKELPEPGIRDHINFYGPPKHIEYISMYEFLPEFRTPRADLVKDKIVLFGIHSEVQKRSQEHKDQFLVPYSSKAMFGAEIHAALLQNLLDGSWLKRFSVGDDLFFLFLVVFLTAFFASVATPFRSMLLVFSVQLLWILAAYIGFASFQTLIPGALLFLPFAALLMLWKFAIIVRSTIRAQAEFKKSTGADLELFR